MVRARKYSVGKVPLNLDKIEARVTPVTRRVRCIECGNRLTIMGPIGTSVFVQCMNCNRSSGYMVPAANQI